MTAIDALNELIKKMPAFNPNWPRAVHNEYRETMSKIINAIRDAQDAEIKKLERERE